jgi:hypothetical protein
VALNMEELPADYEPGPANIARVSVEPRAIARTDFNVLRLANLAGMIVAPKDVQIENVVVRLVGTKVYTTPYADGTFSFYNLREGQYEVEIDVETVPEGYLPASRARTGGRLKYQPGAADRIRIEAQAPGGEAGPGDVETGDPHQRARRQRPPLRAVVSGVSTDEDRKMPT